MRKSLIGLAVFLFASAASAQELPKGTADSKPASKGATEVTTGTFETAKPAEEAKDATEAAISAGAINSSGNSRSFAATANANLRIRRDDNQFTAIIAGNYARAKLPDQPTQTTVENEQGRLRYDRFITKDVVLFLGVQALHDRFRGLDLRAQVDPGVGYYFINEAKHLFWVEGGYDFLYDIRRDEDRVVVGADGQPELLDKTKAVHSGRAFAGYSYSVIENVGFNATIEYLQALTDSTIYRVNADLGISSKLGKRFSLAITYALRYDHAPLPGKEKIDNITSVALVYSLF